MQITRRLEFDAGHRIPDHNSQCRHLHGHRYAIEITLSGDIIEASGQSNNGMVMDFGEVKAIAGKHLIDAWDHAFIAHSEDTQLLAFLATLPNHKTVILPHVPTAENLARCAFELLDPLYRDSYGNHLLLQQIRIYETPNCWADCRRCDLATGKK